MEAQTVPESENNAKQIDDERDDDKDDDDDDDDDAGVIIPDFSLHYRVIIITTKENKTKHKNTTWY